MWLLSFYKIQRLYRFSSRKVYRCLYYASIYALYRGKKAARDVKFLGRKTLTGHRIWGTQSERSGRKLRFFGILIGRNNFQIDWQPSTIYIHMISLCSPYITNSSMWIAHAGNKRTTCKRVDPSDTALYAKQNQHESRDRESGIFLAFDVNMRAQPEA